MFKLCCLIINSKLSRYPYVVLDLPGSSLSHKAVDDYVQMVQSYVLSPGYAPKLFFTDLTLDAVRDAVKDAIVFYVAVDFDVWKNACVSEFATFLSGVRSSFSDLLFQRRKASEDRYVEWNRSNRQAQIDRRGNVSRSESDARSVEKSKKSVATSSKRSGGPSTKDEKTKTVSK